MLSPARVAARSGTDGGGLLFAILCLVWGSTWLSLKIGVTTVPPVTFAAVRFLLAAVPLLGVACLQRRLRVRWQTVLPGAVLMVAVNYGLMAWGITRVGSGIASVINLATVPMATLLLSIAHGQTRWSRTAAAALGLGVVGLVLLFAPRLGAGPAGGMVAIAVGAATYAWGGVLTKQQPVAEPVALAGWQSLGGGLLLAVAALITEPISASTLAPLATLPGIANMAFLVIVGSVIGGSVYLMLLARWQASRVATYAFVCPLIALTESAVLAGELPSVLELAASALLLAATRFSLAAPQRD